MITKLTHSTKNTVNLLMECYKIGSNQPWVDKKIYITHQYLGSNFISQQHFDAPFLNLMPLLQTLVPRACKQGIKSMAGTITCCREMKITAPPNEWRNLAFFIVFLLLQKQHCAVQKHFNHLSNFICIQTHRGDHSFTIFYYLILIYIKISYYSKPVNIP